MSAVSKFSSNSILSALCADPEFQKIRDKFTFRSLDVDSPVQEQDKVMQALHFPLSGMISSVIDMADGETAEICCVGCRGMVNWESLLGQRKSRFRHFVQIRAEVASVALRDLMPFASHPKIANYITSNIAELARNAACNCLHHVDERLARWLLVAADKVETQDLELTQEFLAMMLGARRATVTIAAGKLQQAGFIRYRRGRLQILNHEGLVGASCECYEAMSRAYRKSPA
jgi:CRP-like cAMP-binding protein